MPLTQRASTGRLLRVSLTEGEEVMRSLAEVVAAEGIAWATVSVRGHLASARMELGKKIYSRATADTDRVSFSDGRMVAGHGEVRSGPEGCEVALRCTVGRQREIFLGDLIEAVVGEGATLLLVELEGEI